MRKPFYRRFNDSWYVHLEDGRQVRLARGRGNKREAEQRYVELMADLAKAAPPESPDAVVASLCEAFLDHYQRHTKPATYHFYREFLTLPSGASELRAGRHLCDRRRPAMLPRRVRRPDRTRRSGVNRVSPRDAEPVSYVRGIPCSLSPDDGG